MRYGIGVVCPDCPGGGAWEGTKQQAVLTLLRRPKGTIVAQVAETTGWQAHAVRGFFASLKKRGSAVTVLERVRQAGPTKQGAKGSYTVYRLVG
jgi:predicted ArsR family transcriptional regulator